MEFSFSLSSKDDLFIISRIDWVSFVQICNFFTRCLYNLKMIFLLLKQARTGLTSTLINIYNFIKSWPNFRPSNFHTNIENGGVDLTATSIGSTTQLISSIYSYQNYLTLPWSCSFKVISKNVILTHPVVLSLMFIFMQ